MLLIYHIVDINCLKSLVIGVHAHVVLSFINGSVLAAFAYLLRFHHLGRVPIWIVHRRYLGRACYRRKLLQVVKFDIVYL